jgi:simple sugar transport system permease protein
MLIIAGVIGLGIQGYQFFKAEDDKRSKLHLVLRSALSILAIGWAAWILASQSLLQNVEIPVGTWLAIGALCFFLYFLSRTKLGQDLRSVGQDRHVAEVAGIPVDQVRVKAIIFSTVFAAWGHIIFLQNMGAFSTYGSYEQVGLYATAAILIGGATVTKATIGQALLGVFLFHTLFIVSPAAGRELFGDAQIGEYFRVFVAYGVIGVTLAMHAWKKLLQRRQRDADKPE